MSILLEGVEPRPIDARTTTISDGVVVFTLGDYRISLEEFRVLVMYVMCNSNISRRDDPRLKLLRDLKELHIIRDRNGKRLSGRRRLARYFSRRH